MLTSGVATRRAAAEPPETSRPNLSRHLSRALLVVMGLLLVEVLIEGWLVTWLGERIWLGHAGLKPKDNVELDPAEWPKTLKSALYGLLLCLTIAKFAVDRAWYRLRTWADAALVILALVMVIAGYFGGSSTVLIGQALFVYFRGAIVFYAMRALNPTWRAVRPLCWIAGIIVVISGVLGLAQFLFGEGAYTWLGWVELQWADEGRAQGLFDHPNNLGHVMGLTILDLLAWFVTSDRVKARWWILFGFAAMLLSIAQSRQSTAAVIAGMGLIALLRRGQWRRLVAASVIVFLLTAVPVAFSAESRDALAYRLSGLSNGFKMSGTSESKSECRNNARCTGSDGEVRVLFTKQGVKLWAARPILGYGVGQFGGIVAVKNDPKWNLDPRFQKVLGPEGFYLHEFKSTSVDVFWLHLLVEVGALGMLAYLVWMFLIITPVIGAAWRRGPKMGGVRGSPGSGAILLWAASSFVFAILVAAWSPSLEDPLFPALMFAVLGLAWALLAQRPSEGPAGDEDTVRAGKAETT